MPQQRSGKVSWRKASSAKQTLQDKIEQFSKTRTVDDPAWKSVSKDPCLLVWRVNNLAIEPVSEADIGTFYDGDSYIILHNYNNSTNALVYDAYIWIGSESSIDEYGVAAYKMFELDMYVLDDLAIQHREVQNSESAKFLSLFPRLLILKGGYESGLKSSETKFEPRLLHVSGEKKNVKVLEVSYRYENLNSDDVFIIDFGKEMYQFNGSNANKDEKFKASQFANSIRAERPGGVKLEVIDENDDGRSHQILKKLPRKNAQTLKKNVLEVQSSTLWKISDASGELTMELISREKHSKSSLKSEDVFILDKGNICYLWIGSGASKNERMMALPYAEGYLRSKSTYRIPVETSNDGKESPIFLENFN